MKCKVCNKNEEINDPIFAEYILSMHICRTCLGSTENHPASKYVIEEMTKLIYQQKEDIGLLGYRIEELEDLVT